MNNEEAISRLSNALAQMGAGDFDEEALRSLLKDVVDEKHSHYIEQGLLRNNKSMIMHGIVGSLSHYEAEKEKQKNEKKFQTLTEDD
jgi:hypothetical protein